MTAPDDPESRIRDLERSTGTEATTPSPPPWPSASPWPAYPPPPGMPSPPTRPAPAGVDRPRWLSRLLLALGFLLIVGVVGAYLLFGRETTAGTPSAPQRTGPPPTAFPEQTPTLFPPVPSIPAPSTVPSGEPSVAAPGGTLGISGIEENRTVGCDGGAVQISGIHNTVVITGHCTQVTVSGIENAVTVDSADRIQASGIRNRVTFHLGAPQVDTSLDNTVERG